MSLRAIARKLIPSVVYQTKIARIILACSGTSTRRAPAARRAPERERAGFQRSCQLCVTVAQNSLNARITRGDVFRGGTMFPGDWPLGQRHTDLGGANDQTGCPATALAPFHGSIKPIVGDPAAFDLTSISLILSPQSAAAQARTRAESLAPRGAGRRTATRISEWANANRVLSPEAARVFHATRLFTFRRIILSVAASPRLHYSPAGGSPDKLNFGSEFAGMQGASLRIHLDGRQIAFHSLSVPKAEIWVLDNSTSSLR